MRKIAVLLLTMVVMGAMASVASAKARNGDMLFRVPTHAEANGVHKHMTVE